jgi:ASC-1-like (ASCH) protein
MDHLAIMRKSWGLLPKILAGEKTIESRWYKNRPAPWGKIKTGDRIYFKNSGEGVTVSVSVRKVVQFENLNQERVMNILEKYGRVDGIEDKEIEKYFNLFKNKRHCILIFLGKPQKFEPFEISKTGFGIMAAWISVENIADIIIS